MVVTPKETSKDKVESDKGGLLEIAMSEERMRGFVLQLAADHKVEVQGNLEQALSAFQSRLNSLVKLLVQRDLAVQRRLWDVEIASIKSTADGDRIHVVCVSGFSLFFTLLPSDRYSQYVTKQKTSLMGQEG